MDYFYNREKSNKVITFLNPKERWRQTLTIDMSVLCVMLTPLEALPSPEKI